jgi:hypothetical protein
LTFFLGIAPSVFDAALTPGRLVYASRGQIRPPRSDFARRNDRESTPTRDMLYVAGTIAFFALMILYVRACESLGARHDADEQSP